MVQRRVRRKVAQMEKKCTKCQRSKPVAEFGRNSRMPDGYHYWCKDCVRAYQRSERGRISLRRAIQKKQEEGYYRYGRGAIPILRQGAEKRGVPFSLSPEGLESWWSETPDNCEYCRCTLEQFRELRDFVLLYEGANREITKFKRVFATSKQAKIGWLTIDRRDNVNGYSVGNLVKACWFCNYIKGSFLEYEDMKIIGPRVIERLRREIGQQRTST